MTQKFTVKWKDFKSNVSKSFGLLRYEEYLHDVTLVSDDEKQISAHKLVLSACSDYFKNIFKNYKSSTSCLLICLSGVSTHNLENMLEYMYNGEVQINQTDLDQFMEIAQKFTLQGLVSDQSSEIVKQDYMEDFHNRIPEIVRETKLEWMEEKSESLTKIMNSAPASDQNSQIVKQDYKEDFLNGIPVLVRETQVEWMGEKSESLTNIVNSAPASDQNCEIVKQDYKEEFHNGIPESVREAKLESMEERSESVTNIVNSENMSIKSMAVDEIPPLDLLVTKDPDLKVQIERPMFLCTECEKEFPKRWMLKRHTKDYHSVLTLECEICSKRFKSKKFLRDHERSHINRLCENCNKVVKVTSFYKHIQKCLYDAPRFNCELCEFRTYRKENVKRHMKVHSKSPKEKPYHCDKCAYISDTKGHIKEHLKSHSPKFQCTYCRRKLRSEEKLIAHISKNHGSLQFRPVADSPIFHQLGL